MEAQAEAAHQYYWMWMKRQRGEMFNCDSSSSWDQEKAFAEDRASLRLVGECIWPPRSYSCSFCRREFKSAQALGGHMNVHRRDRARARLQHNKASSSTNPRSSISPSHHHHHHHQYHYSISSPPTNNANNNDVLVNVVAASSPSPALSNFRVSSSSAAAISNHHQDYNQVETSLSVGLKPRIIICCDDDELATRSCKRKKTATFNSNVTAVSTLIDDQELFSLQEDDHLDLELRLGDAAAQKVK